MAEGTLKGRVIDADTRAVLAGVSITTIPAITGATTPLYTDTSGRFSFDKVPVGVYVIVADGFTINGAPVRAQSAPVSVVAAAPANALVKLSRIPASIIARVGSYHRAGDTLFTGTNCVACHGEKKFELTADPTIKPFHALTPHLGACTGCHDRTIELGPVQSGQLGKQVETSKCVTCHTSFPTLK